MSGGCRFSGEPDGHFNTYNSPCGYYTTYFQKAVHKFGYKIMYSFLILFSFNSIIPAIRRERAACVHIQDISKQDSI